MNADHARYAEWDAAYMLGALSSTERRQFDAHLQQCDECRAAIVEIAPTIALLSRVTPDRAESLLGPAGPVDGPDQSRRSAIVAIGAGESRRRRRIRWTWAGAVAASLLVVVILVATLAIAPAMRGSQVVALEPIGDVPITATVEFTDVAWGTRIEMICRYGGSPDEDSEGWPYALILIADDGTESELSSWRAFPGSTARIGGGTALDVDQIAAIEIRSVNSGRLLMRSELGGNAGSAAG